ncbi:molybdopterin converting factor subunit 1 [Aquirhabdus sp.]|uniref:molybdopterin converting factor subunit 1 n=1 Tax=Aquirhabdus sp. TaxID=2824160 RepID=UPI00396D00D7
MSTKAATDSVVPASNSNSIKVLFFARLREKMGFSEVNFALSQAVTVADLQVLLVEQYPHFFDLPQPILVAVNQEFAQPTQLISIGDEVAFFPPVTGG